MMERTIDGVVYDFTPYEVEANGQIQVRYPHYAGIVSPGCECFTCESLREMDQDDDG